MFPNILQTAFQYFVKLSCFLYFVTETTFTTISSLVPLTIKTTYGKNKHQFTNRIIATQQNITETYHINKTKVNTQFVTSKESLRQNILGYLEYFTSKLKTE